MSDSDAVAAFLDDLELKDAIAWVKTISPAARQAVEMLERHHAWAPETMKPIWEELVRRYRAYPHFEMHAAQQQEECKENA